MLADVPLKSLAMFLRRQWGEHDRYTRRGRGVPLMEQAETACMQREQRGGGDNRGLVVDLFLEVEGGETPTPPISLEQWGAEPTILTN